LAQNVTELLKVTAYNIAVVLEWWSYESARRVDVWTMKPVSVVSEGRAKNEHRKMTVA